MPKSANRFFFRIVALAVAATLGAAIAVEGPGATTRLAPARTFVDPAPQPSDNLLYAGTRRLGGGPAVDRPGHRRRHGLRSARASDGLLAAARAEHWDMDRLLIQSGADIHFHHDKR